MEEELLAVFHSALSPAHCLRSLPYHNYADVVYSWAMQCTILTFPLCHNFLLSLDLLITIFISFVLTTNSILNYHQRSTDTPKTLKHIKYLWLYLLKEFSRLFLSWLLPPILPCTCHLESLSTCTPWYCSPPLMLDPISCAPDVFLTLPDGAYPVADFISVFSVLLSAKWSPLPCLPCPFTGFQAS